MLIEPYLYLIFHILHAKKFFEKEKRTVNKNWLDEFSATII